MKKNIQVTKHAIEEYINDNPHKNEKKVEKTLKYLFIKMLELSKLENGGIAKFWDGGERNKRLILNDEVIVYDNYIIITYFRLYYRVITRVKLIIKRKIEHIFNGKLEKEIEKQIEAQKRRQQKKRSKRNRKALKQKQIIYF